MPSTEHAKGKAALRARQKQSDDPRSIVNWGQRTFAKIQSAPGFRHVGDLEGEVTQSQVTRTHCLVTLAIPHAYAPVATQMALDSKTGVLVLRAYIVDPPAFIPGADYMDPEWFDESGAAE